MNLRFNQILSSLLENRDAFYHHGLNTVGRSVLKHYKAQYRHTPLKTNIKDLNPNGVYLVVAWPSPCDYGCFPNDFIHYFNRRKQSVNSNTESVGEWERKRKWERKSLCVCVCEGGRDGNSCSKTTTKLIIRFVWIRSTNWHQHRITHHDKNIIFTGILTNACMDAFQACITTFSFVWKENFHFFRAKSSMARDILLSTASKFK